MEKQILTSSFDKDTGILSLTLLTGERYYITHPAHARELRGKISPGGKLNMTQLEWLERYRIPERGIDKAKLLKKIRDLRNEIASLD